MKKVCKEIRVISKKAEEEKKAKFDTLVTQARKTPHSTKYRDSLVQPGTVLIILSGRYRGKRVVLVRHLTQGTLLVTGPFKINGVPMRRVNHRYVIATSTVVDMSALESDADAKEVVERASGDEYWAREKKDDDDEFFEGKEEGQAKKEVDVKRVEDQKKLDKVVLASVKATEGLTDYLGASFSLRSGERPHEMVF